MAEEKSTMTVFYKKHCEMGGASIKDVAKRCFNDMEKHKLLKTKNDNVITAESIERIIKVVNYQIKHGQQPKRFPYKVILTDKEFKWVKIPQATA